MTKKKFPRPITIYKWPVMVRKSEFRFRQCGDSFLWVKAVLSVPLLEGCMSTITTSSFSELLLTGKVRSAKRPRRVGVPSSLPALDTLPTSVALRPHGFFRRLIIKKKDQDKNVFAVKKNMNI